MNAPTKMNMNEYRISVAASVKVSLKRTVSPISFCSAYLGKSRVEVKEKMKPKASMMPKEKMVTMLCIGET